MRDEEWLASLLHEIWDSKFPDLKKKNNIVARWKGKWKGKFGHIKKLRNKDTEIAINSYFRDEKVPGEIIEITLAHEIVHYMHGFNSPHTKKFKYPHQGSVVEKELKLRGYNNLIRFERNWSKEIWPNILGKKTGGSIRVKHLRGSFRFF